MMRRQTFPRQWLVADERLGDNLWQAVRRLPRGSGILILYRAMRARERRQLLGRLRRLARGRDLLIADEASGEAARVHNLHELRVALLAGVPLICLSPMFASRSHPDWQPLPRMKAAAIIRLAGEPIVALGGMNEGRFRQIASLGFSGWAGIDAHGH